MDVRILAVDDDPGILEMIAKAFERPGYRIDKAGNVAQAIGLLNEDDYDIVITDKNLSGPEAKIEDGMEILAHLRRSGSRTEAIMITGYATIETAIEAMRLGAFDYLVKPFSLEVLKAKVERILGFRQFLNPENTIKSFKAFHNQLLNLFENRAREIDPDTERTIKSILTKVEQFFRVQKEREKIMIEQREALAEIASDAEELREKLAEKGISHELLDKICTASNRRF
jgi:DNA-binding response OmpR family regulator